MSLERRVTGQHEEFETVTCLQMQMHLQCALFSMFNIISLTSNLNIAQVHSDDLLLLALCVKFVKCRYLLQSKIQDEFFEQHLIVQASLSHCKMCTPMQASS